MKTFRVEWVTNGRVRYVSTRRGRHARGGLYVVSIRPKLSGIFKTRSAAERAVVYLAGAGYKGVGDIIEVGTDA